MCVGAIRLLEQVWGEGTARVGLLDDGVVVSLAFVPEAEAGAFVLVHMGIPVEVLAGDAAEEALLLRKEVGS